MSTGDQVIDAETAVGLQQDAARQTDLLAWIVSLDPHEYGGKVAARLVTASATPYVLLADSLSELRDLLPAGLERFERAPSDPDEVIEIWFLASRQV